MTTFRRVREKRVNGRRYWRAQVWDPVADDWSDVENLFPPRSKCGRDPKQEPDDDLRAAWQRVKNRKLPTRSQATLRASQIASELAARMGTEAMTLARLIELEQQPMGKRRERAPRTLNDIRRVTDRFLAFMGREFPAIRLAEQVRPSHIDAYLRSRSEAGVSENTRTKELAYIRHAFNRAVDLEEIDRNPCSKIRLRRPGAREQMENTRGYARSEFEVDKLLAACRDEYIDPQGHKRKPPAYLYPWVLAKVRTGCRFGELLETYEKRDPSDRKKRTLVPGLLWKNIDWQNDRMFVTGKTDGRWVVLTEDLRAALIAFRDHQEELGILDEQVFQSDAGYPVRGVRTALANAVKRANLSGHLRPHDLRHTCFTNLAARGVSPAVIQLLAGHTSPSMTARYVHIAEDQMVNEVLAKGPGGKVEGKRGRQTAEEANGSTHKTRGKRGKKTG